MTSSIHSRSERRFSVAALAVLLGLFALPVAAAELTDEAKAQAREKFTQGNEAYDRGAFREALTAFDAAYKLAPLPGFLFNVAQCHRQLGAYERAAFFYRRYLSLSEKEPANAPMVKELIAEMDTRASEKARAQAKAADRPRAEPAREKEARAEAKPVQGSALKEAGKRAVDSRTASTTPTSLSPEALPGTPMSESPPSKSLARKWWVWAGAGAAVLVTGGIVYAATTPGQRPTTLGTIPGR
jgi:tetratricopeptide (TPR) repeat protein